MNWRQVLGIVPVITVGVVIFIVLLVEVETVRLASAVAFCLLGPGCGWARKMRSNDDGGDTLALALALSICATIAVGTAMALSGWWFPVAGFTILLLITAAGFVSFEFTDSPRVPPAKVSMGARTRKRRIWNIPRASWDIPYSSPQEPAGGSAGAPGKRP